MQNIKATLDVNVTSHGISHPDYFQGHGVAFTDYDRCVTGAGDTEAEALADAISQMGMSCDFDLDDFEMPELDKAQADASIEPSAFAEELQEAGIDQHDDAAVQAYADQMDGGTYWYVSIDWKEPETDAHTASVLKTELEEHYNLYAIIAQASAIRTKQAAFDAERATRQYETPLAFSNALKAAGASITDCDLGYLDMLTEDMQAATALPVNRSQVRKALSTLMDEHGLMLGEQPNGTLYAFEPHRIAVAQG